MLKRQRPPSPPPPMSISLIEDLLPIARHDAKRRRILPQPVDGKSREWAQAYTHDDEEEEYVLHDENPAEGGCDDRVACTAEYKQRNNALRELHTLHQHRLLFASISPSEAQHATSYPHSNHENQDNAPHRLLTSPCPNDSGDDLLQRLHSSTEELHRVTQRYGDSNRFLGNLFLSRRRQLGVLQDSDSPTSWHDLHR